MSTIERHILAAIAFAIVTSAFGAAAQAAIYVKIPSIGGDVESQGWEKGRYFTADMFSFGVEREMKESGEKATVSLTLPLDAGTLELLDAAVADRSIGDVEIELEAAGDAGPQPYLKYKLSGCFIKSWSTSGAADDTPIVEIVIAFEAIAFE